MFIWLLKVNIKKVHSFCFIGNGPTSLSYFVLLIKAEWVHWNYISCSVNSLLKVIKNDERMEDAWILWMKKHWIRTNKHYYFAHCGVVVSSMARVNMVWIMQCSHFLPKQMRLLFRVYEYTKEGFFQAHHLLTSNKNCVKVWNDGSNVYEMHYLTLST